MYRNASITIGTSSSLISPMRYRTEIVITNTSDTATVYLAIGEPASVGSGIVLYPHSIYYADKNPPTAEIHSISDSDNTTIAIMER